MICAIDYGSCVIRSAFRSPEPPARLVMYSERAEYAMLASTDAHRRALGDQSIPFAECDGTLIVSGNHAAKARWLSRVPCTSLLAEGRVPVDDPPARQMLSVLTDAILPLPVVSGTLCGVIAPGVHDGSDRAEHSAEFLCRLVKMRGYSPLLVNPSEASLLASGREAAFTGISLVFGAETTSICITRLGVPVATQALAIGSNWIDTEIARQFQVQMWDDEGCCYIDLESVRSWKAESGLHLRNPMSQRDRAMVRLTSVVLDQITRGLAAMLESPAVVNAVHQQRMSIVLAGGMVLTDGFSSLLTERLVEHGIAERVLSVRIAADPATAVIRGALITAELESRRLMMSAAA